MSIQKFTVTILSGQKESSVAPMSKDLGVVKLCFPPMTSTSVTFKTSEDGTNWGTIYTTSGSGFSLTIPSGVYVPIKMDSMLDVCASKNLKIVSNSSEGADRSIVIYAVEM